MDPALARELEQRLARSLNATETGRTLFEAVQVQGTATYLHGVPSGQAAMYVASSVADGTIFLDGEAALDTAHERDCRVGDILAADYAHEACHARQHAEGRFPDPKAMSREEYTQAFFDNEAEAQALSCQVAAELAAAGYPGAREHNDRCGYGPMSLAFDRAVRADAAAFSNGEARRAAHAAWEACGVAEEYRRDAQARWQWAQAQTMQNDHGEHDAALRALNDRLGEWPSLSESDPRAATISRSR